MKKKYYNDAFIGNRNITVSFNKKGELLRLYYPLRAIFRVLLCRAKNK